MDRYKHVFSPITIRGTEFKNRIEMAPTSPKYTTEKGYLTKEHIDYFRAAGRGGAAVITLGNCSVDIEHTQDEPRQVGLDSDDYIIGISRFSDMCERYGALGSLEINHSGLDINYEYNKVPAIGPSALMMPKEVVRARENNREPVRAVEMTPEMIYDVQQMYINAAYRCKVAGLKMCMVHGGHANLIAQFASPLYNHRRDEYGGKLENRARFGMEILDGIRKKCGEDFVIEFRVSADEMHPDGMHFDETKEYLKLLEDKIDIVNVSAGMHTDVAYFRYWSPNMYMPRCVNAGYAAELKKILRCKVTAVAGIPNIEYAERLISEGVSDFCAMARPLMADPEMPRKYAHGAPDTVVPCTRCNYCGRRIRTIHTVACAVNPKLGREDEFDDGAVRPARCKKTVVVVGAGPAGMQAALTLLERGHKVVLFERSGQIGGNLISAAAMHLKQDMMDYLKYITKTVSESGAEIRLNTDATVEAVRAVGPDALIIAAGAVPRIPEIKGSKLPHVHWAADADMGKCEVGQNVVIIGGGALGLESAVTQSEAGKRVTVLELMPELNFTGDTHELPPMLERNGASVLCGRRVVEICTDKVICTVIGTGEIEEHVADTVLISAGLIPRREVAERLRHIIPETEVYIVGDLKSPRALGDAIHEGFNAALNV